MKAHNKIITLLAVTALASTTSFVTVAEPLDKAESALETFWKNIKNHPLESGLGIGGGVLVIGIGAAGIHKYRLSRDCDTAMSAQAGDLDTATSAQTGDSVRELEILRVQQRIQLSELIHQKGKFAPRGSRTTTSFRAY